jgi:hypothetical protein
MKTKFLIFFLLILNISASDFTYSTELRPLLLKSFNVSDAISEIKLQGYLRVKNSGEYGVSEVYLSSGSRSVLSDLQAERTFHLRQVDSVILNNGELLDRVDIQDIIIKGDFPNIIGIGTINGAHGGDGGVGGGS